MPEAITGSDVEAFAAAAAVLDVGVIELETFIQSFAGIVEFRAIEINQAFRIDNDLGAVTFIDMILGLDLVGIFDDISLSRAT